MCGLVGYFSGCDLKISCPKKLWRERSSVNRNTSSASFRNWDTKASVRCQPSRIAGVGDAVFPAAFVPLMRSSRVKQLPEQSLIKLQRSALFRFLNFTHKLELLVVNTVTASIAMGRYDVNTDDTTRLDAHRLYVDEAYHALFSFEAMLELKGKHGDDILVEGMPAFVTKLKSMTEAENNLRRKWLVELFFVIASEMLISSTLHDVQSHAQASQPVRDMIRDHAMDEARHHTFYKKFLIQLWDKLRKEDREYVASILPSLVLAYCVPDNDSLLLDLQKAGMSSRVSVDILAEVHPKDLTVDYAKQIGAKLFNTIEELSNADIRDHLHSSLDALALQ